jgi:hypothetical protein
MSGIGSFNQTATTIDGTPVVVEQALHERQTNALETQIFSLSTGNLLAESTENLPAADSLTLADAGAALVYDTSVFGATSPILGRRDRFDVTQTAGSLRYTGVLADFRQYWMTVRPFTLAVRGMHFGRYGGDAEDPRLQPSYLGYPQLVRGYEVGSLNASECEPGPAGECHVFDQLIGSRMLVANGGAIPVVGCLRRRQLLWPDPDRAGGVRRWRRGVGSRIVSVVRGWKP